MCVSIKHDYGFCHNREFRVATVQTETQWKAVAEMREILPVTSASGEGLS